jgi:cold-inducible RNA-binding protein
MKKLFIGKLSLSTTESSLRGLFADYEPLASVKVITDKFTGESRGFAFIEIEDSQRAMEAIKDLNGAELDGEVIVVNEARPKGEGSGRSNYRSSSSNRY